MNSSSDPLCSIDYGPSIFAWLWATTGVSTSVIIFRCTISLLAFKKLSKSDILMAIAVALAIAQAAVGTVNIDHGLGKVFGCLSVLDSFFQFKYLIFGFAPAMFSVLIARISFAVYLLNFMTRLLYPVQFWTLWIIIIGSAVAHIFAAIVTIFFACVDLGGGHTYPVFSRCLPYPFLAMVGHIGGAFNTVIDLILTFLPVRLVIQMDASIRIKFILLCVLSTSIFAAIASALRTYAYYRWHHAADLLALNFTSERRLKATQAVRDMYTWDVTEIVTLVVTASVPSFRVLYTKLLPEDERPLERDGDETALRMSHWQSIRTENGGTTESLGCKVPRSCSIISNSWSGSTLP